MVRLRGFAADVPRMPRFRVFLPVLAVLLAFLAVGAGTATAQTAKAHRAAKIHRAVCWQRLLNDWYPDGRIDGNYPVRCYRQAIAHLPEDLKAYGEARNDINRALLAFLARGGGTGGGGPNAVIPGAGRSFQSHKKNESFFARVANSLGPGNATSIPLPLLILAGLGLLLIAAAAASFAARRLQARRLRPATAPPAPPHRK